jgi:hypothetical protein
VTGGSKLKRVLMFLHMDSILSIAGCPTLGFLKGGIPR